MCMGRFVPRAIDLLFVLSVLELVLGVGGHLFEITEIISIRMFLFALILLLGVGHVAVKGYLRLGKLSSLFALIGVLTFLQGSIVGLIHGNQAKYILGDANAFLFPLYGIAAFHFAREHHWSVQTIVRLVLAAVTLLAAAVDLAFLGMVLRYLDPSHLKELFESTFKFEVVIGPTIRIFFINEIFLVVFGVIVFSIIMLSTSLRVGMTLILCTLLQALIASDSRGLQIGALVGFLVASLLMPGMLQKARLYVALTLFLVFIVVDIGLIRLNPEVSTRIIEAANITEPSNKVRFAQTPFLWDRFKDRPLLGNGFGTTVEGVVRSEQNPYSFELVPLEVLMKLGILGPLIWFAFFARMGLEMKSAIARASETPLEKSVLIGSAGGLCAILVASMTNPFFNSSIGMGVIIFFTLVVDLIQNNEFVCRLKRESNTLLPRIIVETQSR